MIYTWRHVHRDMTIEADLCVIGTGAGGAPVAREAARAGLRVVLLEAGSFLRPKDFTQLEHECFPKLYHESAGRTTADRSIQVHQGKGVGGSTLHNINLCARVAPAIEAHWRDAYGLEALPPEALAGLYDEVEAALNVQRITEDELNGNSRMLQRGCEALGWRGGRLLHNRRGCAQAGFCELGCPFDAKENALKIYVAEAVERGALVLADTWARAVELDGRRARRVRAVVREPETGAPLHEVTIEARAVCVSASGSGTAALLQRSGVPDPRGLVGSRLHLHPGSAVAGIFPEPLHAWMGIPQGFECTEHLDPAPGSDRRIWIIPSFARPAGVSSILSGFGAEHQRIMQHYPRMGALSPMIEDVTTGTVRPRGEHGVAMDYWLDPSDQEQMRRGLLACARLLFAAGAERVLVPLARLLVIDREEALEPLLTELPIRRHDLSLTAVHPMSSVWMGDDPERACVDSRGRYHHLDNLFVSDTSLFPTSTGGPPQLTAYALGLHVGRQVAALLR